VWLNNPKRPQEASGTSGMKAAANGVPNCSILDGWWAEAYTPEVGWAIPSNDTYEDQEDADKLEALELLNIIENEIKPCFYERINDVPRRWIKFMKGALAMALIDFSARRMVAEYDSKYYSVAGNACKSLIADGAARAKTLVNTKTLLVDNFAKTVVEQPVIDGDLRHAHVSDSYIVRTRVMLDGLSPEDIKVEAYFGKVDNHNQIYASASQLMKLVENCGNNCYLYETVLTCIEPGRFGLTARVSPAGEDWDNSVPGFVCWPK
jgi:starch phosphorylase